MQERQAQANPDRREGTPGSEGLHAGNRVRAILSGRRRPRGGAAQGLCQLYLRYVLNVPFSLFRAISIYVVSNCPVSSVHGKSVDMEIMVQGKQTKAVTDLLMAKGVPKKWIESVDMTAEKKKKK